MLNSFWESLPQLNKLDATGSDGTHLGGDGTSSDRHRGPSSAAADKILSAAEDTAMRIVEDARAQAQTIQTQARESGYSEGLEIASRDVEARLSAEFEDRVTKLQDSVNAVLDKIEAQRVELWKNSEGEILTFAFDVARKVIKTEVQQDKNVVLEVIRQALRRVVDKDQVRIRINPADLETVRAQREDLMLVIDGARNLEIIDDRRIDAGGCVVETSAGTIDAKLDTQMDQIIQSLEIGE